MKNKIKHKPWNDDCHWYRSHYLEQTFIQCSSPVGRHQVNDEQQHLNKLHLLIRGQSGSTSSRPYQLCPFVSIRTVHIVGQENNIITFYIKKHQRA